MQRKWLEQLSEENSHTQRFVVNCAAELQHVQQVRCIFWLSIGMHKDFSHAICGEYFNLPDSWMRFLGIFKAQNQVFHLLGLRSTVNKMCFHANNIILWPMQELRQSRAHLLNCLLSSNMQKIPAPTYQGFGNWRESLTMGKTAR